MERKYLGKADDGHDYDYFEYYSEHRAYSKPNLQDARMEYMKRRGSKRLHQVEITCIGLQD